MSPPTASSGQPRDFNGRVVLITGAGSGVGLECARVFAAHGAKLLLVGRSADKLEAAVATLAEETKAQAAICAGDVTDPAFATEAMAAAQEAFAAPVEGNELKTTGAFSYVRHPIYGGLLVAATGLSVATESFQRLLVVFLLYLLLDAKSAYEEKELERIHPAYRAYKQVTPKFFPSFDELDEILD